MRFFSGYNQARKFPRADVNVFVDIEHCNVIRIFNLRIVMQVQKCDVLAIADTYRTVIRFIDTDNAEHIQVCKGHIFAVVHLYRLAIGTFAALFLGLHAIHLPVGHLVETYFISYMMLDGHGIDTPRSRSIVGIETIGGICACCPDVFKGAATVVGHPQTPILVVPSKIHARSRYRIIGRTDTSRSVPPATWFLNTRFRFP